MNMICPSGCPHRAPAAMKASPAGVHHDLERHQQEDRVAPHEDTREADEEQHRGDEQDVLQGDGSGTHADGSCMRGAGPSRSPAEGLLPTVAEIPASQVIGADEGGEQQDRREFHGQQVLAEERGADGLGPDGLGPGGRGGADDGVHHLEEEDRREHARADPGARFEPAPFAFHGAPPEVQHHDDEQEQHDDGAGVDDDLQCRRERRAEEVEHHRDREQGHDQVDERVRCVQTGHHERGPGDGDGRRDVEQR